MNGFFNIWKPTGMSSAAIVSVIRRLTGEKRVGHAGTLDPEAAGVLPVMTGKAARLFDYLVDKQKEYVAVIRFGSSTDTQDATGTVIETGSDYPSLEKVREKAGALIGEICQRPSMYSAIKVNGKPLYERARRGETVEVPVRTVRVDEITFLREMPDHAFEMKIRCGKGTYIRSICDDLGKLCGCPAHMSSLVRTQSGIFTRETSIELDEARELADRGQLWGRMLPPDYPLAHMCRTDLDGRWHKAVSSGAKLPCDRIGEKIPDDGVTTRIYMDGVFWGIAQRNGDELLWRVQIAPENETGAVL